MRCASGCVATETLAVSYAVASELVRDHRISDATYARARAAFGEQGVIELVSVVGYYCLVALVLNAFEVPLDAGRARPVPGMMSAPLMSRSVSAAVLMLAASALALASPVTPATTRSPCKPLGHVPAQRRVGRQNVGDDAHEHEQHDNMAPKRPSGFSRTSRSELQQYSAVVSEPCCD